MRLGPESPWPRRHSFCWIFELQEPSGLLTLPINVSRAFFDDDRDKSASHSLCRRIRRSGRTKQLRQGKYPGPQTQKPLVVLRRVRASLSLLFLSAGCANATPPNPQIRGFKRQAAASSAMTSAIVRWALKAHDEPKATSRAPSISGDLDGGCDVIFDRLARTETHPSLRGRA